MKGLRSFLSTLAFLVLCLSLPENILGHGRLWEPCGRNTLWRVDSTNPPDYNDMEVNCRDPSSTVASGGLCGACGDGVNLPQPRPSENGGTYGRGVIARTFEAGKTYPFTCEFTATHMGVYGYDYYVLPDPYAIESNDTKAWTPLQFADGSTTKELPPNAPTRKYTDDVMIPADLQAERCVIRWRYVSGNSWGTCDDGSTAMGCGEQETFYGCSDTQIIGSSRKPEAKKYKRRQV